MKLKHLFAFTATAALLAGTAFAMETHPVTGEKLSENQELTYRLLDQFPTLDPQLNEETAGFHVIRDIFEGLISQDENGNLIPGVALHMDPVEREQDMDLQTARGCQVVERRPGDRAVTSSMPGAVPPIRRRRRPMRGTWKSPRSMNAAAIIAGDAAPDTLGVRALDDYTLEVDLDTPASLFPEHDHLCHAVPGASGHGRGVRRRLDQAREHRVERRLSCSMSWCSTNTTHG